MPIHLQINKPIYINIILYFYCIILFIFSDPLLLFHPSLTILHLNKIKRLNYQYISNNFSGILFYIYILFHR